MCSFIWLIFVSTIFLVSISENSNNFPSRAVFPSSELPADFSSAMSLLSSAEDNILIRKGNFSWRGSIELYNRLNMEGEKIPPNATSDSKISARNLKDFGPSIVPTTRLWGEWRMDGPGGRLRRLSLANQRRLPDTFDSVRVLAIYGGQWFFDSCEITGAGTGQDSPALLELRSVEDDISEEDEEALRLENESPLTAVYPSSPSLSPSPPRATGEPAVTLRMRACALRKLPPEEIDLKEQVMHSLAYVGGGALLDMEGCSLVGGDLYGLLLYDDAAARLSRCDIRDARTEFALDDGATLELEECAVAGIFAAFHLWAPGVALSLRRNRIEGQVCPLPYPAPPRPEIGRAHV